MLFPFLFVLFFLNVTVKIIVLRDGVLSIISFTFLGVRRTRSSGSSSLRAPGVFCPWYSDKHVTNETICYDMLT